MREIWKNIEWAPGYRVSSFGRISGKQKDILTPTPNSKGYPTAIVYVEGKRIHQSIHRIACETFIGIRPLDHEVNHKDGNRENNCIENLEYISISEHRKHTKSLGRRPKGENHWKSKLSNKQILEIRSMGWVPNRKGIPIKNRISTIKIAKKFNISSTHVHEILTRKSWKHI